MSGSPTTRKLFLVATGFAHPLTTILLVGFERSFGEVASVTKMRPLRHWRSVMVRLARRALDLRADQLGAKECDCAIDRVGGGWFSPSGLAMALAGIDDEFGATA